MKELLQAFQKAIAHPQSISNNRQGGANAPVKRLLVTFVATSSTNGAQSAPIGFLCGVSAKKLLQPEVAPSPVHIHLREAILGQRHSWDESLQVYSWMQD
jgi:hypothetical protein